MMISRSPMGESSERRSSLVLRQIQNDALIFPSKNDEARRIPAERTAVGKTMLRVKIASSGELISF